MRVIVWLHRDLRVAGNPALEWASRDGREALPLYVHAPDEEAPWAPGGASRWWLHHSLGALASDLAQLGMTLRCAQGRSLPALLQLAREQGATAVAWNRRYQPLLAERDTTVARALGDAGIDVKRFDGDLLLPPERLLKDDGTPYRVYTPFAKRLRRELEVGAAPVAAAPQPAAPPCSSPHGSVEALGLLDPHPWHGKLSDHWRPGETAAWERLERFLNESVHAYDTQRDVPGVEATSRLSPHLAFGEISPAQVWSHLRPWLEGLHGPAAARGAARFLDELLWREFAHHVLAHFPHSAQRSLDERFEVGAWHDDPDLLTSWQRGTTGFDLVDAGMHELWSTGWMHNRVRMVAASFLTKQMGVHWRHGAAWFWDTLVDADLANNTLGWQWVAGCGVDAAPFYRIFNPELQARKFDADAAYRDRWLTAAYRARPPAPRVDLPAARVAALDRYRKLTRKET